MSYHIASAAACAPKLAMLITVLDGVEQASLVSAHAAGQMVRSSASGPYLITPPPGGDNCLASYMSLNNPKQGDIDVNVETLNQCGNTVTNLTVDYSTEVTCNGHTFPHMSQHLRGSE